MNWIQTHQWIVPVLIGGLASFIFSAYKRRHKKNDKYQLTSEQEANVLAGAPAVKHRTSQPTVDEEIKSIDIIVNLMLNDFYKLSELKRCLTKHEIHQMKMLRDLMSPLQMRRDWLLNWRDQWLSKNPTVHHAALLMTLPVTGPYATTDFSTLEIEGFSPDEVKPLDGDATDA